MVKSLCTENCYKNILLEYMCLWVLRWGSGRLAVLSSGVAAIHLLLTSRHFHCLRSCCPILPGTHDEISMTCVTM